ncbi:MAG: hypothetical protein SVE93_07270 [Candidatus Thermoplasmatota archaeon]|nr:hypothetical protein [Candidatus Thermoplasmatota archaeon]
MRGKILVATIGCMVLFTSVAAAQRPLRDLIDRIFGRETEVQVTEIKDILDDPEEYENETVTVEGTFGSRVGYGWMRGDIYGVYDEEGNGIDVQIWVESDKIAEQTETFEEYRELQNKWQDYVNPLADKEVRVTGVIDTSHMDEPFKEGPMLVVTYDGDMEDFSERIEVIE